MSCLPIATQPEAEAGTVNDKTMTPLRVKQAIDALGVSQDILASSTGGGMVGILQAGTGAVSRTAASKFQEHFSVKDFGAVGDGVTDDTAAVHAAFRAAIAATTDPYNEVGNRRIGWGQTAVYFPKGKYKVTEGFSTLAMVVGLKVYGAGKMASAIEFHSDSEALFKCNIHIGFIWSDLSVIHVPQDEDRHSWTCRFLDLNGTGGGRTLHLERIETRSFDRLVHYRSDVNCDTLLASHCDFWNANEILYARNAQAMINEFQLCTIHGYGDGLNISGFGQTLFNSCNITLDGTTLKLFGESSMYGDTAIYTFVNTKWEPTHWEQGESNPAAKSRSAIVKLDGDKRYIECCINLIGSGMTSGYEIDPDYPQLEMTSNMLVRWQGGTLKSACRILLTPTPTMRRTKGHHKGLFFEGMLIVPPPTQIDRGTATGTETYPQVVYQECRGVSNICVASPGVLSAPVSLDRARQTMQLGSDTFNYSTLTSGAARVSSASAFGTRQEIEDIVIDVHSKASGTMLVEVSLDNFATTLDSFNHPVTGAATYCKGVSLKALGLSPTAIGEITTDGIYVRCSGAEAYGRIYVQVRAR